MSTRANGMVSFDLDGISYLEWLYFFVSQVELEIWNRKESILKNVKLILKIAHTIDDVGAKLE